jgi:hypothetical protein
MFSYFLRFYISLLEIYISNFGARPVLVHFWEYIFRNWITVHGAMEAHCDAIEAHRGPVEAHHGPVEAHHGAVEAHYGAVEAHQGGNHHNFSFHKPR